MASNDPQYTQADLDAVTKAITSGKKKVKFRDREVEYRDLDELFAIRDAIVNQLCSTSRFDRRSRHPYTQKGHNKGRH